MISPHTLKVKFSLLALAVAALTLVSATPSVDDVSVAMRAENHPLEARQTCSGCHSFASPTCCVTNVCMCASSRIYYINKDNQNRGLYGCDPPWDYIGTGYTSYPFSGCRSDGAFEKAGDNDSVETIEASPLE